MNDARQPSITEEVESFLTRQSWQNSLPGFLSELSALHERARELQDEASAARLRHALLLALDDAPAIIAETEFCQFLCREVGPEDFSHLRWKSPEKVIRFCESLYSFPFPDDETSERIRGYIAVLLREALRQFESDNNFERMLYLWQTAPTTPAMLSGELLRLRNRIHLYEIRRVRRNRRILYGYLIVQAIMITIVFPLLFVYAENGQLRDALQQATDVDIPEKLGRQYLSYSDGLYWSIITAASIGYGDVTPRSNEGRFIAAILGTMGVLTIGVVAGLILSWITPRQFD